MATRRGYGSGHLFFRTDSAGHETWYAKWRTGDRQVKRRIGLKKGPGETLSRRAAEARMRELMALVAAEDVGESRERTARAGGRTILELWETYRDDRGRELKRSTLHDYGRCVENWLVPHLGDKPIHRITRADVDRLVVVMGEGRHRKRGEAQGLASKSIRNYVTLLSTLLNYAVRQKRWISENVAADITVPTDENDDTDELRFLQPHEVTDLVAALARDDEYGQVDAAMALTAVMAGLRQGELLALRWESVDFAGGRLRIVRNYVRGQETSPKSKQRRSVPLAPPVAEALAALQAATGATGDDLVFADPHTGGPLARTPLMKRYRAGLRAAGIVETFRYHDLRHSFGTRMAAAGVPVTTIQAWMGHSSTKTTERYMHYAPAHDDAARIAAAFATADPRAAEAPAVA